VKPFQLFRHILDVSSITNCLLFNANFSRGTDKIQLQNLLPKQIGVLEHCREGKTNSWFSIFLDFSF
jgi:hypothetical protein